MFLLWTGTSKTLSPVEGHIPVDVGVLGGCGGEETEKSEERSNEQDGEESSAVRVHVALKRRVDSPGGKVWC